jgi:hypothetical protein
VIFPTCSVRLKNFTDATFFKFSSDFFRYSAQNMAGENKLGEQSSQVKTPIREKR